jgi:hypothetical protein
MNMRSLLFTIVLAGFCYSSVTLAQSTDPSESLCPTAISQEACDLLIIELTDALRAKIDNDGDYEQTLNNMLKNTELMSAMLNSPFLSNRLDKLPVNITFKVLDIEEDDSVLALEFDFKRSISNTIYSDNGKREKSYSVDFSLDGTATQNDEENPRNFIDASLSFSLSNQPTFNEAKAVKALKENYWCTLQENINDIGCAALLADGTTEFFEQFGSAYFLEYGVDLSYETDQSFEASNTVISGFLSVQYEDFRRTTFIGANSIVPSIRIGIDTVKPNADTPRAMQGDDSSYERLSAEFHLAVPLTRLFNIPYLFSYNYRMYDELDASSLVKEARLDSYRLRTYSLSTPIGLFVSYSSGKLPFGLEEQNTVELGFKTYF